MAKRFQKSEKFTHVAKFGAEMPHKEIVGKNGYKYKGGEFLVLRLPDGLISEGTITSDCAYFVTLSGEVYDINLFEGQL